MAIVDPETLNLRGRMGGIVYQTYNGLTYAHKYTRGRNPRTALQQAHRDLYGQLQLLGSVWLHPFIKQYRNSTILAGSAYRQFIHYNWGVWDKTTVAWKSALPFYGYTPEITVDVTPSPLVYPASVKITLPVDTAEEYRYISFYFAMGFGDAVPQEIIAVPAGQDYLYLSSSKLENWNQLFCSGNLAIKVWCSDEYGYPYSECKTIYVNGGTLYV
jgi:hypothetical protein